MDPNADEEVSEQKGNFRGRYTQNNKRQTKIYKSKKSAINKVKYKQTKARSHKAMDRRTDAELGNTDDLTTQTKTHMD